MKKYRNRTLSDTVSTVGSMLLFLMFTGCLLLIIAVAAGTYSRISGNFDKTFGSSSALRYLSNKLRNSSAEISEHGIILRSDGIADVIYFSGGGLYEKTVTSGGDTEFSGGDRIFELGDMTVADLGKLYKITVTVNGDENSTFVRKG